MTLARPQSFARESLRLDFTPVLRRGANRQPLTAPSGETRLPRPYKGEPYLGGPIPMSWIERAATLPGRAWHLACALWFEALCSRRKSPDVRLPAKTRRRFGLSRWSYPRALHALQAAGLIRVGHRTGRAAVITLLPVPRKKVGRKRPPRGD
jgi:hypothetical protein